MQNIIRIHRSTLLRPLVFMITILIFKIIICDVTWSSIPLTTQNNSPQDQRAFLKPNYIDISTELTANKLYVFPNQTITYTFKFKSIGNEFPKNLKFIFYAPNEMLGGEYHGNFTRFEEFGSIPQEIHHDSTVVIKDGTNLLKRIHWSMASLTDTLWHQFTFTIRVDNLTSSRALTGIMILECDPDYSTQRSCDVILRLPPEFTLSKSVDPKGPYKAGDSGTYAIIISNNGMRDLDFVTVKDIFPAGIIMGILDPPGYTINKDTIIWNIGILPKGTSRTFTIGFNIPPNFSVVTPFSLVLNIALLQSGTWTISDTVSFNVVAPDIEAKIGVLPKYYSPGHPIQLKAEIKNIGPTPIQKPFKVAFYLNKIQPNRQIGEKITIPSLLESSKQVENITTVWENPPEGDQTVFVYADCESEVLELVEIKNNIDSTIAKVQISELRVFTNELTYYDNPLRNITPQFPQNVFLFSSVLDQNFHPVHKLALASDWASTNGLTQLNTPLKNIWLLSETGLTVDSLAATEILSEAGFPIATTIVIPISKQDLLTSLKVELCKFINKFSAPKDKFAVVPYSNHLLTMVPFTDNFATVCNVITQESTVQPTALYDAIYRGVAEAAKQPGRRAVIAVTDGNNFSFIQYHKVIEYANRLSVPIFILNYGTANRDALQALATRCGGLYYDVTVPDTLSPILGQLYDILNNYYIVSYSTPAPDMDGAWRPLDITLKYPNYLAPIGRNNQGIYLAPADTPKVWMDIASFPSGLTHNYRNQLWKLTTPQENFEYVITLSNCGHNKLESISLTNWKSPYVNIDATIPTNYLQEMGQNHIINFMAGVKEQLPSQWLSIIDSAKVFFNQNWMASAWDTVWLIQDLTPEIRVTRLNEPYPQTEVAVTITLLDSITIWVSWPIYLADFRIILFPEDNGEIDITSNIQNMPRFPAGPDTIKIIPNYRPPKKFTEKEKEKWIVRLVYVDELGQTRYVETYFYIIAPNKLILDRNISRRGEPVEVIVFIARENRVKINIYNVAGEHVRQLENAYYPKDSEATTTGKHLIWNCDDTNGRTVGSGVYVFVMEAGTFKTFAKVVVVH